MDAVIAEADKQGWQPLPLPALTLIAKPRDPSISLSISYGHNTPLSILQQMLTNETLIQYLLAPLNAILANARHDHEITDLKRLASLDIAQWWCFVARWVLENVNVPATREDRHCELRKRASRAFGDHRFSAVHARLIFGTTHFLALVGSVRQAFANLVTPGSIVAIDDQLISYFGQDMRNESLAVQIPDKPHGYGLFSVGAAVKLPKSGRRLLIDIEVQEASYKITPQSALVSILSRLRSQVSHQFISIFDSAFVTKQTISRLTSWDQLFVASLKLNRAADFSAVLKLGSADIPTDQSRTFAKEDLVLQISQRVSHITSILTNAFSHPTWYQPNPQSPITHTTSWNLYAVFSLPELTHLFPAARLPQTNDPSEIAKRITGIDPLLPPHGEDGKQTLTLEYMDTLDVPSLRLLATRMKLTGAINSMLKKKLIDHISIAARLTNSQSNASSQSTRPEKNIENRAGLARGPTSTSHIVTDFFGKHYGFIDQFNREFFCVFKASGQNHYKTLLALQLVSACMLNSYALHSEIHHPSPRPSQQGTSHRARAVQHGTCLDFVLDLAEEILDLYAPKAKLIK